VEALELRPRDPLARDLLRRVRAGRRIKLDDVRKDFQQRLENRG
jgi:hypothetical protein